MPCCHSASISSGMLSTRYSLGIPMRLPLRLASSSCVHAGTARSSEVESFGSNPAIASSMIAQSLTSRAIGPAWSSDEENATTPQREQRPLVGLFLVLLVFVAGWRIVLLVLV